MFVVFLFILFFLFVLLLLLLLLLDGFAETDTNYWNKFYRGLSVCCTSSVTLMHPGKALVWNAIPCGRDTRVFPNNIVLDSGAGPPREGEQWRKRV